MALCGFVLGRAYKCMLAGGLGSEASISCRGSGLKSKEVGSDLSACGFWPFQLTPIPAEFELFALWFLFLGISFMLFSFGFGLLVKAGMGPRIRGLICIGCFRRSKLTSLLQVSFVVSCYVCLWAFRFRL